MQGSASLLFAITKKRRVCLYSCRNLKQVRADVTLEEGVNRNWGEITSKVQSIG